MSKVADRNQRQLLELLKLPGNGVCADCKALNPRWASHNLGIFICQTCAGLHRKMGTHISKVKSLTLDTWSREQVNFMRDKGGNDEVNSYFNGDERRNRLNVGGIDEGERNSQLEKYIRNKYESRSFMASCSSSTSTSTSTPSYQPPPPRPSSSSSSTTHSTLNSDRRPSTPSSSLPSPSIPSIALAQTDSTRSITSSPDSVKHVRFRANSVPIPEIVSVSMSRPNSRLEGIKEVGIKPTGILRARSQTVNVLPSPPTSTSTFSNNPYANGANLNNQIYNQPSTNFIQSPSLPISNQPPPSSKLEQPRMNSSIWDDIDILAGKPPPLPSQPIRSFSTPNPLPQIQTQFQPSSQFGQSQYQNDPFDHSSSSSPFIHTIQQQQYSQYPSNQYPIASPGINFNSNPFMNMNSLSTNLPTPSSNYLTQSYPQQTQQSQIYSPQLQIQQQNLQSTQSINNSNPFFQPSPLPSPYLQPQQQSMNPYAPQYSQPLPTPLSTNINQQLMDNSNPFIFNNQPQPSQQQPIYNQSQQQQGQMGGYLNGGN